MTEFFFNGEQVTEDEMESLMEQAADELIEAEAEIVKKFGVSTETASAMCYLRTRSRWSVEKELELIERDRAGNPISLSTVLSGDF